VKALLQHFGRGRKEILERLGSQAIGDLFTEQDIYEQIRKITATC